MTAADLVQATRITQVWLALGGGELRHGRGQAFWRGGDGWSISLDDDRGLWFDHRDAVGGGVLDLIRRVHGSTRGEALIWMASMMGLKLDDVRVTPEARRRYARARQDAPGLARQAWTWWRERLDGLELAKAVALENEDLSGLKAPAQEHFRLSHMEPDHIVRAYLVARRENPVSTAALVDAGEDWERWCEAAVGAVVSQLASKRAA